MDRNRELLHPIRTRKVALRKESVDRNIPMALFPAPVIMSLSARRAWIEITLFLLFQLVAGVALRKESVDRNMVVPTVAKSCLVALRKESVDRNSVAPDGALSREVSLSARRAWIEIQYTQKGVGKCRSRSPQGERG